MIKHSVILIHDQTLQVEHGLTLLVECAAKALADACSQTQNLVAQQVQQLADALLLVILPRLAACPKLQVGMQQRAIQHAMAGLQVLLELEQHSVNADQVEVQPKIPPPTIHLITHAATLQLQRNSTTVNLRYAPEPSVRLENVRLALALLSNLVCYRMWSFGVLQFLKIVVTVMQLHKVDTRVQLHGVRILENHCQLRWSEAYDAVNKSGGREALVELIGRFTPTTDADATDTEARAEIVAVACHALRLLLEANLASAFSREQEHMESLRVAMMRATVNNGGIEHVIGVLASQYASQHGYADMPPPQVRIYMMYIYIMNSLLLHLSPLLVLHSNIADRQRARPAPRLLRLQLRRQLQTLRPRRRHRRARHPPAQAPRGDLGLRLPLSPQRHVLQVHQRAHDARR
jgi:hypothetical protein